MSSSANNSNQYVKRLKAKMTEITELEQQLQGLPPGKSSEQRSSAIRLSLCEKLSDVILTDPNIAAKKDCGGRLWRNCFYARINELRGRIARERRKQGKGQQTTTNNTPKPKSKSTPSSSDSNVKKLELSIGVFLNEAIILYQYLVDKYEEKLSPPSRRSTQVSLDATTTKTNGVVPGLYRLLINLGDLHRYDAAYGSSSKSSYEKAEAFYTKASKLAPGRGNPYNQLAVVAQLKDSISPLSCVSLFWYARALLATDGPFEMAGKNLSRLFHVNRESLKQQNGGEGSATEKAAAVAASGATQNKTAMQDLARAQKSAASRQFIANFVDVHYDFFCPIDNSNIPVLVKKILALKSKLLWLLDAAAFGDSLLCKMLTINAFSVHVVSVRDKNNEDITGLARALTMQFGASMARKVEASLQKVIKQKSSSEVASKPVPSVRLLLPLLLVCDFVATFKDEHLRIQGVSDVSSRRLCNEAVHKFWSNVAVVANLLNSLRDRYDLESVQDLTLKEYENLRGYVPFLPFIKQLGSGGDPNKYTKDKTGGFAAPSEAVKILELYSSPSTQDSVISVSSTGSSGSNEEFNKAKILRFLGVVDHFADKSNGAKCLFERDPAGLYSYTGHTDEIDFQTSQHDEPAMDVLFFHESNNSTVIQGKAGQVDSLAEKLKEASDVLMYKQSGDGSGPALLVPGAFLLSRTYEPVAQNAEKEENHTQKEEDRLQPNTFLEASSLWNNATSEEKSGKTHSAPLVSHATNSVDDPMDVIEKEAIEKLTPPPPPGIIPPPGLAPPPGFTGTPPPRFAATVPVVAAPSIAREVSASAPFPPPGFLAEVGVASLPALAHQTPIPVFGRMDISSSQTANPFTAQASAPAQNPPNPPWRDFGHKNSPSSGSHDVFGSSALCLQQSLGAQTDTSTTSLTFLDRIGFNGFGTSNPEDASLMDSGLLSTLWAEEKSKKPPLSKNPFLA